MAGLSPNEFVSLHMAWHETLIAFDVYAEPGEGEVSMRDRPPNSHACVALYGLGGKGSIVEAEGFLRRLLMDETIATRGDSISGDQRIDPAEWSRGRVVWDDNAIIRNFKVVVSNISVNRFELRRQLETGSRRAATIGGETRCEGWLLAEMKKSPNECPKTKADFCAVAVQDFPVSQRAFNTKIWPNCVRKSGSNWGHPGRKKNITP